MSPIKKKRIPCDVVVKEAAETVGSIDDLLIQILIRLPIRLLLRFKIVSKQWLSLITSRQFCLLRNPFPNLPRGLFLSFNRYVVSRFRDLRHDYRYISFDPHTPDSDTPSLNFDFTVAPPSTVIVHSCNGLLLCCSSNMWDGSYPVIKSPDSELYVYNPTTRCFVMLPHYPSDSQRSASLVFDPYKSSHYKVVLVEKLRDKKVKSAFYDCDNIRVLIYSSATGIWTNGGEMGGTENVDFNFPRGGVYWNGSVHWRNKVLFPDKSGFLLRYHVDSQAFHEMPTPPVLKRTCYSDCYFGESCGHLHFVEPLHFIIHPTSPQFNVYEMKDDYSEWFIRYQVDLLLPLASYPEVIRHAQLDGNNYYVGHVMSLIREDGNDVESCLLILRIPGKVLKYNLLDGTLQILADIDQEFICSSTTLHEGGITTEFNFHQELGSDYIPSLCNV